MVNLFMRNEDVSIIIGKISMYSSIKSKISSCIFHKLSVSRRNMSPLTQQPIRKPHFPEALPILWRHQPKSTVIWLLISLPIFYGYRLKDFNFRSPDIDDFFSHFFLLFSFMFFHVRLNKIRFILYFVVYFLSQSGIKSCHLLMLL